MKKLQSTWYNMSIVLTLISVVAGAALAYVNDITYEPIQKIKEQQLQDGIKAVLSADKVKVQSVDTLDGVIVYVTNKGKAVQASDPNGFGGKLTVLVGFDKRGAIQGYRVLESAETPGLGAKAGEWFQKGSKGCIIGMSPAKNNMTVKQDGGDVDAITASTITSRAFLRCVNAAYEAFAKGAETETDGESGATRQYDDNY